MVWVVSRFRFKPPPVILSSCISPLTSSGQCSRASWASQPQKSAAQSPQPGGKPRKFIRTCGGIGEKKKTCSSMAEKLTLWNITWDNVEIWCQYQHASHVWLYCTYQCCFHTHMVVCHLMSRIMAVRVLMVSERSYRNITLILTVITTSNPTLMTLFDRSSFLLWDTMLKTCVLNYEN
jgi:hypothetical protein